ncbi:MAG: TIGR02281 family clan AA aspartic protease, partial [Acidovorax sp.]|nr:TIGR02281 family clan AA aspartic protease [Acidovorax sp.]
MRSGASVARHPLGWGAPVGSALLLAMLFAAPLRANAQAVALSGMLGSKALLVVDGSAPRAV